MMTDALQQAWAVYAERALPANADINQRASAKQAFYNGALLAARIPSHEIEAAAARALDEDGFIFGEAIDEGGLSS